MHEASIAESVLFTALDQANIYHALSIDRVILEVGNLAGIEIHSLLFALHSVKIDKLLSDTEFEIHKIRGKSICKDCGKTYYHNEYGIPCPKCKSIYTEVIRGKDLIIRKIDFTTE